MSTWEGLGVPIYPSANFSWEAQSDDLLISFGVSASTQLSFDLRWYGNEASGASYLYFDASANLVYTEDIDFRFADNDEVQFGDSDDVTIVWDGTNLIIKSLADDGLIEIGDSAATQLSFDLKWYGDTANGASYLYFDASANLVYSTGVDLQFKDSDYLVFGTGAGATGDVQITWDATNLLMTASADDSVFEIGDSAATQKSFDVKIYGDAANGADYVLFDASTSRLDMAGAYSLGLHRRKPVTAKTGNYTCLAVDSGTIFTNTGATAAVTFTLPAVATTGWTARFFAVADYNLVVASAAGDDMVVYNDAAADSVAFQTGSQIVGGGIEVVSDGTRWLVWVNNWDDAAVAQTITKAT